MINYIWILIGKKLSNEASDSELEELDRLLREDTTGNYPLELIEMLWEIKEKSDSDVTDNKLEENWDRLSLLIDSQKAESKDIEVENQQIKKKPWNIRRYLIAIAACLLLIVVSVGIVKQFLYKDTFSKSGNNIEIATTNGAIRKIALPDGSSVVLNSGSNISYKKTFNAKHRELFLSGEALFDIVKDPEHPFIVHTQEMRIRVLGTKFNVKAYPDDNTAEASLFRGSIELTVINEPERKILLKPSEKIKIIKEPTIKPNDTAASHELPSIKLIELGSITQKLDDTLPEEVMWLSHTITFDSDKFGDIAKEMERKYNVSIIFQNQDAQQFKFTGRIEDISLDEALEQLQLIAQFHYTINGRIVKIY